MTALIGDLSLFYPVDIFQFLGFVRARGALVMARGEETARVYFEDGRITGAEAVSGRPLLGSLLKEAGDISEQDLEASLQRTGKQGERLGEALVNSGLITTERLETALEDQLSRTVHGLLKWRDGVFEFNPGVSAGNEQVGRRTSLDRMLFEGLKRMDEEAEDQRRAAQ